MHIIKIERPFKEALLVRIGAVVAAMAICALLIVSVTKLNPIEVFVSLAKGSFGSSKRLVNCLRDAFFLWLIAIGLAPAFKMRFWNNGAEGQILMGGLASAAVMIGMSNSSSNLPVLLMMGVASIAAGALWSFIPAYFAVRYKTNESLMTLMMNYIALQIVEFMVDIWDKKQSHTVGIINAASKIGWFGKLFGNQYGWVFVLVALIAGGMYVYLNYSKQGYEIEVVGESERTAQYGGINVNRVKIRTVVLSGALCALAGFISTAGISHTISDATSGGKGFTAIIVAFLGKFSVPVMGLMSFLITFLEKGANTIASQYNFNEYGANILVGIILLFIIGSEFFCNYKIIFKKKGE